MASGAGAAASGAGRVGAAKGRSEVAAECVRRIRASGDGGERDMDKRIVPGVRLLDLPPSQTGFAQWQRGGKPRGTALWAVPQAWDAACGDRVLFLHGGAYLWCSPQDEYRPVAARLAAVTGMPVLCPDYRLAPESHFPDALTDARDALLWIARNGPDGPMPCRRLFLFGDSAGGGLGLALTISCMGSDDSPRISAIATVSAYTDLTHSGESYYTRSWDEALGVGDPVFSRGDPDTEKKYSDSQARKYYATQDPRDPLVSPYHATEAQLRQLPPTLMLVGDEEQLLCDTTDLARRARGAGAPVTLVLYPHMWHDWICYAGEACQQGCELAEGMDAFRRVAGFFETIPVPPARA
eukprot:TRINITY_DN1026_c0_g1_i2.p1 TRINITY_DN1026_c0_g1~~TRINITY_DN1026_c0_g1_i2.p1  ORF type:complete len:380 (+),score=105.81 TRINITY_DN1026_c0_g1_i2:82-1140(+)